MVLVEASTAPRRAPPPRTFSRGSEAWATQPRGAPVDRCEIASAPGAQPSPFRSGDDQGGHRELDPAVGHGKPAERTARLSEELVELPIVDTVGERPSLDVRVHPGIDRGEARHAFDGPDLRAIDSGLLT